MPDEKKPISQLRAPVREGGLVDETDKEIDEMLRHARGGRPCDGCDE